MATGFEFFERDLRLATTGLEPEAINAELAKFARKELRRVISEGIASSQYEKYVNGIKGAVEESVHAPGPILYEFTNWPLVIKTALEELKKRGPRPRSGRFDLSYLVIVGGRVVVTDYTKIRSDAEVIILNAQPYSRKAEVGRLGIPERRLFAGTARFLAGRFRGAFTANSKFLSVPAGILPLMPYRLKGRGSRDKISRKSGVLSYPAIIINPVS